MTFAEKNNKNCVVVVNIENNEVEMENVHIPVYASLLSIPSQPLTIDGVLDEIEKLPSGAAGSHSPYLEIKILIDGPDTAFRYKIEEALKDKNVRLACISPFYPKRGEAGIKAVSFEQLQALKPIDVANDYYKRKYGDNEMPDIMKNLLKDIIAEVKL